jgi:hypothetical protein
MAQRDKAKTQPPSDLIRAVSAERLPLRETIVVSKSEAALLAEAMRRGDGILSGTPIDARRALGTLARSAPDDPGTAEVLAAVMLDPETAPAMRLAAVAQLGTLPAPHAEPPLLRALRGAGGPLRHALLRALAQVGTAESYKLLRETEAESEADARQLALARTAIAAREPGLIGPALDVAFRLDWENAQAAPLDRKRIAAITAKLSGSLFSIRPSPDIAVGYSCGGSDFALMPNAELGKNDLTAPLFERDRLAAVLVSQAARGANWTLRLLVLTQPDKDRLRIVMVRPNGDPMFEGTGERGKEGVDFRLRETGLERTPTTIEGRISGASLTWNHRVWRGPMRPKRRPVRLAPVAPG